MKKNVLLVSKLALVGMLCLSPAIARADDGPCKDLPSHAALQGALAAAQALANGGFGLEMWGTVVNRDGALCSFATSMSDPTQV